MKKEWIGNLRSERTHVGSCVEGHLHTDSCVSVGRDTPAQLSIGNSAGWVTEAHARAWVCLSCGKEFANMAALVQDSY